MSSRRRARDRGGRARSSAAPAAAPSLPLAHPRIALVLGTVVTLAAFALYLATAARDIVFGDTPELMTAALTLGVAHPPGYPLFTILGWLFGQLPVGPVPFRVNLLSVVAHAATVGVVYAMTYRFARSIPAAVVSAAALATEPLFWSWSLVAEVFPLNDLLSISMLFVVALWHERPERTRLLVLGALIGGIGMTDHQTIALLAPAVLYVMWRQRNVLLGRPVILAYAAGAFVLGLSLYLELPIAATRQPSWNWGDLRTFGDLVAHVLRQTYGSTALVNTPAFAGGSALPRIAALLTSVDPAHWVLLLIGTTYAIRSQRWFAAYLLIAFAVSGPAFAAYANIDVASSAGPILLTVLQRFFLLPHTVIAPLAGFAIVAVGELGPRIRFPRRATEIGASAVAASGLALIAVAAAPAVDRSRDHIARNYGLDILNSIKPGSVVLIEADAPAFSTAYLQTVEGVRRDLTLVGLPLLRETWYVRQLGRSHPELVLSFARYGIGGAPVRTLIDANRSRPLALVGDLDASARTAYWAYPRGITFEIRPLSETVPLDQLASENEPILRSYHPAAWADVMGPYRAWERATLVDHAMAYYRIGEQYESAADELRGIAPVQARARSEIAKNWYERALGIYPQLTEAKEGLARLARG